jgi:hypothetical protein
LKCMVCDRETLEKFCEFHEKAYRNVVQKFEYWKRATGVSWKEYLKELVENAYTGCWAKEVAESLLKNTDG